MIASSAPPGARLRRPLAQLLLVAAVCASWANALDGPFQFDDFNVIVDNPRVHSLAAWARGVSSGIRPLLNLSYTLNWLISPSAWGFHLANVVLHAANTVLAHDVSLALGLARPAALVAALLFGLHPIQTEAVTYVSGRSVSLMACGYLASLLAYMRACQGSRGWHAASVACFGAALATKEVAVTLPLVLLTYEAATGPRGGWPAAWRRVSPHGILLGIGLLLFAASPRYRLLLGVSTDLRSPLENVLVQLDALAYLVRRLLYPVGLCIDPALPVMLGLSPSRSLAALVVLVAFVLAIAGLPRWPVAGFAVLWFFLLLIPTNSLLARADVVNERQIYLAALGPFVLLALGLERLRQRYPPALFLALALPACLAAATVARNEDYRSEVSLWRSTVRVAPHNVRAWNNLAWAWHLAGCWDQAEAAYAEALRLAPDHPGVLANRDALYVARATLAPGGATCASLGP